MPLKNRLHTITMNEAQIRAISHALKTTPEMHLLAKAYEIPFHDIETYEADTVLMLAGMFDGLVNQPDSEYDRKNDNGFTL